MKTLLSPSILMIIAGVIVTVAGGLLHCDPMIYGGLGLLGVGSAAKAVATKPSAAKLLVLLPCVFLVACSGVDERRLELERRNLVFAEKCADGWFGALPYTPDDVRAVRVGLAEWRRALDAEQALLGPVGAR